MCEWTKPNSPAGDARHRRRGAEPCDECRAALCQYQSARRAGKPVRLSETLWRDYRLRMPDYSAMLARQGDACAVCGVPFATLSYRPNVDHDHECDRLNHPGRGQRSCPTCVRGLLCGRCNTRLTGLDDKEWLKRAVEYLSDSAAVEVIRQSRLW